MTVIGEAIGAVQRIGGQALANLIAGDERLSTAELASSSDPGLFGPTSMMWRINGDSSVLVGAIRSLLLQSLHPLAMAGVDQHSNYHDDPWGRLNRTGRFVGATTFGSKSTAEQVIEIVRSVHGSISGVDAQGRTYSAADPHLLRWVHIAQVDSFLEGFRRHGPCRLTDAEEDQYVLESAIVGRALGATHVPETVDRLRSCLRDYRGELESTPEARAAVRFLAFPPRLHPLGRAPYGVLFASASASLPLYAQRMLRLPAVSFADPLMVRPAATVVAKGLGWFMAGTDRDDSLHERLQ
ncbi:MAG: oxygenase MpaB family protein [Acidimicrobiales bacterium]